MSNLLRAGIVGYGYMGEIRHRNILAHPRLELAGVSDPCRTEHLKANGLPTHQDYRELVDSNLDVVFICTPNNVTPEATVYALERGRHVFCEKPPGRTLGDVQRICAAERASPAAKLIFGFNHRHHPGIIDAKALIDGGALGRILTVRGVYGKSGGANFESSWRNDPGVGGGGILLDQGIHMLDLFRFFCGDFEEVTGMRTRGYWNIPVEDNAFVLLRTRDGVMAQLHSTATSWKHTFRLEIGLECGYVIVSGLLSKTGSYGRETLTVGRKPEDGIRAALGNPREETTYYDVDPSWDLEVEHFVHAIVSGTPIVQGTSLDALRVMEIVDRVYQLPVINFEATTRTK